MSHPGVRIIAAADLRREARETFRSEFGGEAYVDVEDLCKSPSIDAIYVATPHRFHASHAILAAEAGKHAIVEKPMALTLEDCDAMIRAAERHKTILLVGHTHSFDPPILKMREIVRSGELGRLGMINTWNFTDFLYRPRHPEELDTDQGGGIIFNQVPHQIDTVRLLGGGLVASVRAATGAWDNKRPTEGACVCFLEFADGAGATVVYSGYDHFDSDELHGWIGESGQKKDVGGHGKSRQFWAALGGPEEEATLKASTGYGGPNKRAYGPERERHHPHFGFTVVSCARGDMRPSARGVWIYDDRGSREVQVPLGRALPDKGRVVDEFYNAVVNQCAPVHDGLWGKATLEVCLAILESVRQRREIFLSHQVPARDS
jgi:phthalate 4,5-cis-dihydrodiol dehydrogenase